MQQITVDASAYYDATRSTKSGMLLYYDPDDWMIAIASRKVSIVDIGDAVGSTLTQAVFQHREARRQISIREEK